MAAIQRIGFTPKQNQLSNIFKALGHPARLKILEILIAENKVSCKQLAIEVPLSPTTVNRHTRFLFEHGVIGYEKRVNYTNYVMNPLVIETIAMYLNCALDNNAKNDIDYSDVHFHLEPSF